MDFLKILRSFEEFLFEAISWLVFLPRTLWRVVRRPLVMADYAEKELEKPEEIRYTDTVSPPLFLILSLGLAHVIELLAHARQIDPNSPFTRLLIDKQQNLLIFRSIVFSIWPLIFSVDILRRKGLAITRNSLRGPFFAQCFFAAPFALGLSSAMALSYSPNAIVHMIAIGLLCLVAVWYLATQARWVRAQVGAGWGKVTVIVGLNALTGLVIDFTATLLALGL